ncbi:MAG: AAA family ATPase [Armatimonadetes bacterium]|nr:AAA family ATPase [Armatimonadota bacterium]
MPANGTGVVAMSNGTVNLEMKGDANRFFSRHGQTAESYGAMLSTFADGMGGPAMVATFAKAWAAAMGAGALPPAICFDDIEATDIDWIWPNHLARGKLTIIEGDPGKGKGLITMDIAARLSRGEAMPDGSATPKCNVLFLTGEDDAADTEKPRLEAAGADASRVFLVPAKGGGAGWNLGDDADMLAKYITDNDIDLLIIDPLTEFLPAVDTHRGNDVRVILARLRDAAVKTRCAVLAVRHLNKGSGAAALYRGGGSIAFTGAARFVFTVGIDPDDKSCRALACTKCNVAREVRTLLYRPVQSGRAARVEWLGESDLTADQILSTARDQPSDQAKAFLLELLADGPVGSKTVTDRATQAGLSTATLNRAKKDLGVQSFRTGTVWEWALKDWVPRSDPFADDPRQPTLPMEHA